MLVSDYYQLECEIVRLKKKVHDLEFEIELKHSDYKGLF